ncbi:MULTISPECIES: hypothetical protein [Pseudomonas]|jgi:hypothetical protein|uniref:hypothetical protein n=1 Tax=Pseudomonas TaxID=286 RepID=UPI0002D66950|nr:MULTISPECIES: hypothetical protein [Pseudomonas]MBA1250456.1 hypothetical protein [Pseudomonas zeshuii]MBW5415201.1 hypothetical protein [Pseudomonas sp. MAG002Y]MCG7373931.1 hypothetical protein [Pseudomonas luteola]QEU26452.1 hypothetical protein FOB45_01160 [Pseudomonas luteola]RRW43114.1 hypothetical protein EGJ50_18960 [Pseudomonas luteola]
MQTLKTVNQETTWLHFSGVSTTYHLDWHRNGLRVVVLELEGLPTVAQLIEGESLAQNFTVLCTLKEYSSSGSGCAFNQQDHKGEPNG